MMGCKAENPDNPRCPAERGPITTSPRRRCDQVARTVNDGDFGRRALARLCPRDPESANLLVGCFDRGYETAHHWINRAAIATNTPALFAEISTHIATIGPCVLPNQAACYMCYRMRRVACEENYDEAMAYERFLNQANQPSLSSRATAPFLPAYVASVLAGEIVKLVALTLPATLAGRVIEFDALTLESRFHTVLRQPDCPVCGPEKKRPAIIQT